MFPTSNFASHVRQQGVSSFSDLGKGTFTKMGEGRNSLLLTAEAVYQGSLQQSHRYDDFAVRKENITAATISLPGKKLWPL